MGKITRQPLISLSHEEVQNGPRFQVAHSNQFIDTYGPGCSIPRVPSCADEKHSVRHFHYHLL